MRAFAKVYWALVGAAGVLLAGCGGTTLAPASSSAFHQAARGTPSHPLTGSNQDLLYVTDDTVITVYTYPGGDLVQSFYGYGSGYTNADCVDSSGNVYVTFSYGATVEYAHGGTDPIGYFDVYSSPQGCAVDPTTGNLAVANPIASSPYGGHGFIVVFEKATGGIHYYTRRNFREPLWCGYDKAGNLFLEGYSSHAGKRHLALFELPHGGSALKDVSMPVTGGAFGVQYDGKYLTVGAANKIYQLHIKGSKATVVGTTTLSGTKYEEWKTYFVVTKNGKQGRRVVAADGSEIAIFDYPAGGDPTKIIKADDSYAATVSLAQK